MPTTWLSPRQTLFLDLGAVRDIAVVKVNDVVTDTLWKAPYVADVSKLLRPGNNKLQVLVTNQWNNRLVGDAKAPENGRVLTKPAIFGGATTLKESGLLGPVQMLTVK